MKVEFMSIPDKGICIVISDFNGEEIKNIMPLGSSNGVTLSNPYAIANEIERGRKIGAIKEFRAQTGWGLKDSKEYIDKYCPMGVNNESAYAIYAKNFLRTHTGIDGFIEDEDFKIE